MTDNELQVAIDKTAILARESAAGSVREMSYKHLQELMNVQAVRAGLATQTAEAATKKEFSVESWNKGFDAGYDKAREEFFKFKVIGEPDND